LAIVTIISLNVLTIFQQHHTEREKTKEELIEPIDSIVSKHRMMKKTDIEIAFPLALIT
jgi:hypothetical protein